jgi:hypothetical protein
MVLLPDSTVLTNLSGLSMPKPPALSRLILLFIRVLIPLLFTYILRASVKLTAKRLGVEDPRHSSKDQYATSRETLSIHNPNILRNPKFHPHLPPHLLNLHPLRQLRQRQPASLPHLV